MKQRASQPRSSAKPATGTAKPRRSRADRAVARQFLSLLKTGADMRVKKVKRIRQSVRTRTYENELKLTVAMDRMVRDLSA